MDARSDAPARTTDDLLAEARARLRRLEPAEALSAAESGAIIVDVRSETQRERDGVVPGSIYHPRNVLEWRADPAGADRDPAIADPDREVVVMCDAGYQSSLAAAALQELGLRRATDLAGGFQAWRAAGLPVEPAPPRPRAEPPAHGSPAAGGAPALAAGVASLGTESAFSVLARARELEAQGRDVIHLEIGEPDFDTPAHVSEAAFAAIRNGETHYCPSAGIAEFRAAIAEELARTRGVPVPFERVLVGNGAKPFLFFTILATCEPGDEVVYPDPGFPIYESAIRWAGATPVPLALHEEHDFSFDLDELEASLTARTKLVILNSPQNPTGGVIPAEDLAAAAAMIARTPAWVLSDEVYSRLLYGAEFASIASVDGMLDRTVLLDGLSKTYAMTGWRCGYACVPEPLVEPLTRFFVNSTSCVPPFIQHAGIAALQGPQDAVTEMVGEFRARRDLLVDGLNALPGVSCRTPLGAFYAFPNVSRVPLDAETLAARLLDEAGVATVAGSAFGAAGRDHLRFSYANSRANLEAALERTGAFLAQLG